MGSLYLLANGVSARADAMPGWSLVRLLLPCPGTMVDFICQDDRRLLSGRFANGGFNDLRSGDFYAPLSILCWRAIG